MTDKFETVRLRILGEDYTIACEPGDRELLKSAAPLLDEHIEAVQRQDPMLDSPNVLMLVALKLATNLLQSERQDGPQHGGDHRQCPQREAAFGAAPREGLRQ